MHKALTSSKGVAYCDTDSNHCKSWDGEPSNLLGGWKLELAGYRGEFLAPKIYRLTENKTGKRHVACKGFPVNEKDFEKLFAQGAVSSVKTRLMKTQFKERGTAVVRKLDIRQWAGMSSKRKPLKDGSTVPWTVQELLQGLHKEPAHARCPLLKPASKRAP